MTPQGFLIVLLKTIIVIHYPHIEGAKDGVLGKKVDLKGFFLSQVVQEKFS
jgi:hypothetical protein